MVITDDFRLCGSNEAGGRVHRNVVVNFSLSENRSATVLPVADSHFNGVTQ